LSSELRWWSTMFYGLMRRVSSVLSCQPVCSSWSLMPTFLSCFWRLLQFFKSTNAYLGVGWMKPV